MKFNVNSLHFFSSLSIAEGSVSKNKVSINPITQYFLFHLIGNQITISSTDMITSIKVSTEVSGQMDGKICVPSALLLNIIKSLGDTALSIHSGENKTLSITTACGNYTMPFLDGEEFPESVALEPEYSLNLNSDVLLEALKKCQVAIGSEKARPSFRGVYVSLEKDKIYFVATDALKLVEYCLLDDKINSNKYSFILPKKGVELLIKNIPHNQDINIEINKSLALFAFQGIEIKARLIVEPFVNYKVAIPENTDNELIVEKSNFLESLKRVVIFADKTYNHISLEIENEKLKVRSKDIELSQEASEMVDCAYKGENSTIVFNAQYLIELCSQLDTEKIEIKFSNPSSNALILPYSEKNQLKNLKHLQVLSTVFTEPS